jgi:AraC-like DNA-binding protein
LPQPGWADLPVSQQWHRRLACEFQFSARTFRLGTRRRDARATTFRRAATSLRPGTISLRRVTPETNPSTPEHPLFPPNASEPIANQLLKASAKPIIRRSGVSAERRKPWEIEDCGFLPKAATPVLQRSPIMNSKLNHIHDWLQVAKRAGWSVKGMADHCGVSARSLERHFVKNMGRTPIAWLKEHRQKDAGELIHGGSSIKQTAAELGYNHSAHLTRDFKKHWGCCPTQFNPNYGIATANLRSSPPTP